MIGWFEEKLSALPEDDLLIVGERLGKEVKMLFGACLDMMFRDGFQFMKSFGVQIAAGAIGTENASAE